MKQGDFVNVVKGEFKGEVGLIQKVEGNKAIIKIEGIDLSTKVNIKDIKSIF